MLDSLIVAYVQFVIMLMELQKVVSHERKCLCSKRNESYENLWMRFSYVIITLNILYRNVCILYVHYSTIQVSVPTSGVVIHCLG